MQKSQAAGVEVRVVIGVDFGTTFSGFAYGHRDEPEKVFSFYEWPCQVGKPYCKTPTSIFYFNNGKADAPEYEATLWGWPAPLHHMKEKEKNQANGVLASQFKLFLAPGPGQRGRLPSRFRGSGSRSGRRFGNEEAEIFPGVTVVRAITDYLSSICRFALEHVQVTYGEANVTAQHVQWCLTVPAIWDDAAKQVMRNCAQRAGIVTGPLCPAREVGRASPHPLLIVLESEAASFFCAKMRQLRLVRGDEFLVADVGGGTVDIVVHTKDSQEGENLALREVRQSRGDMCGGTFVDANFLRFVSARIPCFDDVVATSPGVKTAMLRKWEEVKAVFGADEDLEPQELEIPSKLRKEMKTRHPGDECDGELVMSGEDLAGIFDPVIDRCIGLIRQQLTARTMVLLLVGGFSASPYLRNKVRAAFQEELGGNIVMPPEPGRAVCHGAVLFGFFPQTVVSRVSRKTYGIQELLPFEPGDPEDAAVSTAGGKRCGTRFTALARKGETIAIHQCVKHNLYPQHRGQKSLAVRIYSSSAAQVRYVTDPGVEMEGEFVIDIADDAEGLGLARHVVVSMFFGLSCVDVKAQRTNFGDRSEIIQLHDIIGFEHS